MKKVFFLAVLAVVFVACDKIERKPFGDAILTLVENQTKSLKGLECDGETILPTVYQDIVPGSHSQRVSLFIAERDGRQTLYRFAPRHGENALDSVYSAKKITRIEMKDKDEAWMAEDAGGITVLHAWMPDWKTTGPWDEVYPGLMEYVVKKNGLYGCIVLPSTDELAAPVYEDVCVTRGMNGTCYCLKKKGEDFYSINHITSKEYAPFKRKLAPLKVGQISRAGMEELKSQARKSGGLVNEHVFSLEEIGTETETYRKYRPCFGEMGMYR